MKRTSQIPPRCQTPLVPKTKIKYNSQNENFLKEIFQVILIIIVILIIVIRWNEFLLGNDNSS